MLNHRDLHAQADAEIGLAVLTGPTRGGDHALGAAHAEAARHEDALRVDDGVPGLVVVRVVGDGLRVRRGARRAAGGGGVRGRRRAGACEDLRRGWRRCRRGLLEVRGVDPGEFELAVASHGGVLEGFDDGEVGVVQFGVFADEDDVDGFEGAFEADGEFFPALPGVLAALVE